MSCLKCKIPTTLHPLCTRHLYCQKCSVNLPRCQYCHIMSSCSNCPNKSLNPICVVSDCQHKLCSECLNKISASKNYSCPLCRKPVIVSKLEGYLKYFSLNTPVSIKDKQIKCKNCGRKGNSASLNYHSCQQCGYLECLKHLNSMKICRCRCLDCYRETKFDFNGRVLDCRCITSDTHIRQKSPSPYRPVSSRQLPKHYLPYQPTSSDGMAKINGINIIKPEKDYQKIDVRALTPVNQKQRLIKTQDLKSQFQPALFNQNNLLKIPNNQYFANSEKIQKPQTSARPVTPKNYPPLPIKPNSPMAPSRPGITITEPSYLLPPKAQRPEGVYPKSPQSNSIFINSPSSTRAISPIPSHMSNSPRTESLPKKYSFTTASTQTKISSPKSQRWKCKKCQSVLECKKRKSGMCTFCSLTNQFVKH